jgi:SAM-dependent methyltransferase
VQKIADDAWLQEISAIYRDYEMYHQSTCNDQPVFDALTGRPTGRCEVLARRLIESRLLPRTGALLDVGAGAGAMLGAFSSAFGDWSLFGLDLDSRKERLLKQIPRFKRLFLVPPEQVEERFDLVTLIHSLEHFADPLSMLQRLRDRLAPGGKLFVQVNNVDRTAFDLVVADHLCHFNPASLSGLLVRAGFQIDLLAETWVNKEISLLASAAPQPIAAAPGDPRTTKAKIESEVAWLARMLADAREAARAGSFGIFGTSVAATWLAADLGDRVAFFVDEDPARRDRLHLGRPILAPTQVAPGSTVYLAFVPAISDTISRRLANLPVKLAAPREA